MGEKSKKDKNEEKDGRIGDQIWILIPLTALMIPIFAVVGNAQNPNLIWAVMGLVGTVAIVGAVTLAVRSLMTHRHELRLEELEARERIVRAEREQLTAAERLLDLDRDVLTELEQAVRKAGEARS